MTRLSDTSAEAERVLTAVYRRMSPGEKWLRLGQTYQDARILHAAGVRLRNPAATPREIHDAWLRVQLGVNVPAAICEPAWDRPMQNLSDLREVLRVFTGLSIAYALGGSMASSVYGIDRFTRDADITAEPFP